MAEIKNAITTRYKQWRANPFSVQSHAPASHPVLQPLVARRGINTHGTNTPTSSSTPSSSRSHASVPLRSRTPSPYEQSPTEDDRALRERVLDAPLREDPHRREDVHPVDGARRDQWYAREDYSRQRREMEEEQRQLQRDGNLRRQRGAEHATTAAREQDGILHRQREAEHTARLGQQTGQYQGATGPVMPVSSVQYPSISEEATRSTASASSGPVTGYLQIPLASESLTRCVVLGGHNGLSWSLNYSITDPAKTSLTNRESYFIFSPGHTGLSVYLLDIFQSDTTH